MIIIHNNFDIMHAYWVLAVPTSTYRSIVRPHLHLFSFNLKKITLNLKKLKFKLKKMKYELKKMSCNLKKITSDLKILKSKLKKVKYNLKKIKFNLKRKVGMPFIARKSPNIYLLVHTYANPNGTYQHDVCSVNVNIPRFA